MYKLEIKFRLFFALTEDSAMATPSIKAYASFFFASPGKKRSMLTQHFVRGVLGTKMHQKKFFVEFQKRSAQILANMPKTLLKPILSGSFAYPQGYPPFRGVQTRNSKIYHNFLTSDRRKLILGSNVSELPCIYTL